MRTYDPTFFTCPYCKRSYITHVMAILHFEICTERPHLQKLSDRDKEALYEFSRELDAEVAAERARQ
jgi:hypothetical protein